MKKGKLIAVVPVRAGSQRVKDKNIKPFANSNLLTLKLQTLKNVANIDRIIVNSVGEGGILVSNYNGDLENGDYVTTCPLEGLGMKQDDDLLHNYTVAKVTQDVTFLYGDPDVKEITYNGQTYKYKFVGCTYHCG